MLGASPTREWHPRLNRARRCVGTCQCIRSIRIVSFDLATVAEGRRLGHQPSARRCMRPHPTGTSALRHKPLHPSFCHNAVPRHGRGLLCMAAGAAEEPAGRRRALHICGAVLKPAAGLPRRRLCRGQPAAPDAGACGCRARGGQPGPEPAGRWRRGGSGAGTCPAVPSAVRTGCLCSRWPRRFLVHAAGP